MPHISLFFFGIFSLLFLLFAYLQWNDPDPEIWVSIYVFAAIMCALAAFKRYFVPVLLTASIVAFLGGLYFFPASVIDWILQEWRQADLSMKTIDMEEARESFGLLIISVVMGLAAYKGRKKRLKMKQD
jgi:predicted transporter